MYCQSFVQVMADTVNKRASLTSCMPLSGTSVSRIIKASNDIHDIHTDLEQQQYSNNNFTVFVHRKCVDKYCHPKSIQKVLREKGQVLPCSSSSSELDGSDIKRARRSEIQDIEIDRDNYHTHINTDICSNFQSDTMNDILSKLSKKLNNSLPPLMIGNMITAIINNLATPLQIVLSVLLKVRYSKKTSEGSARF